MSEFLYGIGFLFLILFAASLVWRLAGSSFKSPGRAISPEKPDNPPEDENSAGEDPFKRMMRQSLIEGRNKR